MRLNAQIACLLLLSSLQAQSPLDRNSLDRPFSLQYRVEWRLVDAGRATLKWTPANGKAGRANVYLESQGIVNRLFRVKDDYSTTLDERGCTLSTLMRAEEGSRKRETLVTYDRIRRRVEYKERDLIKNTTIDKDIEIPGCTFDVVGALVELRRTRMDVGSTLSVPVSDGKKFVNARVEVQAREKVITPAGEFNAIRCEAYLFDGVLYARKARLHVWFSDDADKLPIQIRIALRFYIGTVTLQLEKRA